jgi:hypothetical protein
MSYSFPVLENDELLPCLEEMEIPITAAQLGKPTYEVVAPIFENILVNLTGITRCGAARGPGIAQSRAAEPGAARARARCCCCAMRAGRRPPAVAPGPPPAARQRGAQPARVCGHRRFRVPRAARRVDRGAQLLRAAQPAHGRVRRPRLRHEGAPAAAARPAARAARRGRGARRGRRPTLSYGPAAAECAACRQGLRAPCLRERRPGPTARPRLQDVHKPETQRLRRHLSAVINFAKFREEKLVAYAELQARRPAAAREGDVCSCRGEGCTRVRALRGWRGAHRPQALADAALPWADLLSAP